MENKKRIIIVVSILVLYFIIMTAIFGLDQLKNKIYHLEMIIGPDTYLKYEDGKWYDVIDNTENLLSKSYKIYEEHNFLYEGTLQYTDENWYAFDKNNKPLSLPDRFFAFRSNRKVDVASNYTTAEMSANEKYEAKELLRENKVFLEPEFTKTLKIEFDLNGDGNLEQIYIISNALGMDEQDQYFSIAYIKINDKIEPLILDISTNSYAVPSLNLKEILDYNDDGKQELIFEKIYFNQIGTCHEIFEYEENSYKSVKKCEIIERGDEEE